MQPSSLSTEISEDFYLSEGCVPDGVNPEEATKMIRRMKNLSCEDRLRSGDGQPEDQKA